MDISRANFVTTNEILADVLMSVDDESFSAMSPGFYRSQVQQALEELSFDTFFDEQRESFPFPHKTLSLEMPKGAFNLREIYVFNGNECIVARSQKLWWKRNYFTKGHGYFANNKGSQNHDPFIDSTSPMRHIAGNVVARNGGTSMQNTFFFNVQNGLIMFSPRCSSFSKVHIVYNGTGCDVGDIPVIPQFLRQAVKDYVCEVALRIRMAKDPSGKWGMLWKIYDKSLNRDGSYGPEGSWSRAEYRVKTLSRAKREDLKEYLGRNAW